MTLASQQLLEIEDKKYKQIDQVSYDTFMQMASLILII